MKKNYTLEFEIVMLSEQDLITTSGGGMTTYGRFSGFGGDNAGKAAELDFSGVTF